jgi:hypothetical protein
MERDCWLKIADEMELLLFQKKIKITNEGKEERLVMNIKLTEDEAI